MWRRDSRGFTLLELVVTLFVIMVTIGLVAPVISRSSEAIRARSDVAGFSAVLRHARERAITTRQPHFVVVDPANRKITVLQGSADGEVKQTRQLSERLKVEATSPPAFTVRFEPEGTSSGADYKVTTGDVVYRVTVDPITGRVKNTRL
jgi:Tfp pilus assembly protein FimT